MRRTSATCLRPVAAIDHAEPTQDLELIDLAKAPWTLRVGATPLLVRPSSVRDLAAVAQMHARCTPRSLLDRYRAGGRPPAVAALDASLRAPFSVVATTAGGEIVAIGSLVRDRRHDHLCAEIGLLVEDAWQRLGIGRELAAHLAGVAQAAGYHELIAYPATALAPAQRLMIDLGRTRIVPDVDTHLHTYVPDSATLGLGSVRQRLAG